MRHKVTSFDPFAAGAAPAQRPDGRRALLLTLLLISP